MDLYKRIEILYKDFWSNKDIQDYLSIKSSVAKRIKKSIVDKNNLNFIPRVIEKEYILSELGLSIKTEIEILSCELEIENDLSEQYSVNVQNPMIIKEEVNCYGASY